MYRTQMYIPSAPFFFLRKAMIDRTPEIVHRVFYSEVDVCSSFCPVGSSSSPSPPTSQHAHAQLINLNPCRDFLFRGSVCLGGGQVRTALDTSNFEAVSEEDKVLAYTGPQKLFEGF